MNFNKYLIPIIGILSQAQLFAQDTEQYCRKYLKDLETQRAQFSSNQSYASNPYYRSYAPMQQTGPQQLITQQIKVDAVQVLKELQQRLASNHQNCQGRHECMRADIAVINKFRDENHDAVEVITRFKGELKKQFEADILPSELTIYQQLTPAGQQLYKSGITLKLPQQMNVNNQTSNKRVYYNIDEMLIALMPHLSKAHKACADRSSCLRQDVEMLANIQQQYPEDQRFGKKIETLVKLMNKANDQDVFATAQFLSSYISHLKINKPMHYVSKVNEDFKAIKSKVAISAEKRSVNLDETKHKPLSTREQAKENAKKARNQILESLVGEQSERGGVASEEVKPKKLIGGLLGKLLSF